MKHPELTREQRDRATMQRIDNALLVIAVLAAFCWMVL
jgi:hypothetical protein